jgi:hypothetical protein
MASVGDKPREQDPPSSIPLPYAEDDIAAEDLNAPERLFKYWSDRFTKGTRAVLSNRYAVTSPETP